MTDTADVIAGAVTSERTASPWAWRADRRPWSTAMVDRVSAWTPTLSIDMPGLADAVISGFAADERWICHPLSGALTHDVTEGRTERDLGFVLWVGSHLGLDGRIELDRPRWCFSPTGGFVLDAGCHDVAALATNLVAADVGLAVDPWCTLLGYPAPDTCPATMPDPEDQRTTIERNVLVALRAQAYAAAAVPDISAWITSLVDVVVPLDGTAPLGRSASRADLPGLVFLDTMSEVAVLELLVHEAAHHLLYFEEVTGPLVDPDDAGLFRSPLRTDLRPLRGILLAYHALAFICAMYRDLDASAIFHGAFDAADIADLASKRDEAGATLHTAAGSLTDRGLVVLRRTDEVAAHGS